VATADEFKTITQTLDTARRDSQNGFFADPKYFKHWEQSDEGLLERLKETFNQRPVDSHGSMFGAGIRGTSDYSLGLPPFLSNFARTLGNLAKLNEGHSQDTVTEHLEELGDLHTGEVDPTIAAN